MIRDRNISWKTKRIDRDFRTMYGNLNGTFEGTGGAVNAANAIAASELTDVQVGAAGDEFYDIITIPWDMDIDYPLRWRLIYDHTTTDLDTPTFTFSYMPRAEGEAIADITSVEDTTHSGVVSAVASAVGVTSWVETTSQSYITSSDVLLLVRVTATDLGGAGANELELFSLQLEYTIAATATDNRRHTTESEPV
jgi:hypothetical protein